MSSSQKTNIAKLRDVGLHGTNLSGATLRNADLSDAWLHREDLDMFEIDVMI